MTVHVAIRIGGELAKIKGDAPFAIQGADRSGKHTGFVMTDRSRVNCVRFDRDSMPVIFTEPSALRMLTDDLNRR